MISLESSFYELIMALGKKSCTEHLVVDIIKTELATHSNRFRGGISVSLERMVVARALLRLEIRVSELLDGRDNGDRDTGVHKPCVDDALQRAKGGQG